MSLERDAFREENFSEAEKSFSKSFFKAERIYIDVKIMDGLMSPNSALATNYDLRGNLMSAKGFCYPFHDRFPRYGRDLPQDLEKSLMAMSAELQGNPHLS